MHCRPVNGILIFNVIMLWIILRFCRKKQARTRNFLNRLAAEVDQITAFDIIEALDILNEDRIASDARRFYGVVLDSETQN